MLPHMPMRTGRLSVPSTTTNDSSGKASLRDETRKFSLATFLKGDRMEG